MTSTNNMENDLIAFVIEDYDSIGDIDALNEYIMTDEGLEELERYQVLYGVVKEALPSTLEEYLEKEKSIITVIADGVTELVRRTGERLELQKQSMRELVIKIGSRVIFQRVKTAPGAPSQTNEPELIDEGEFTVEVTSGKDEDTIVIEPKK